MKIDNYSLEFNPLTYQGSIYEDEQFKSYAFFLLDQGDVLFSAPELINSSISEKFRKEIRGKYKWLECGLCHGAGKHYEYEEEWLCASCATKGGSWDIK